MGPMLSDSIARYATARTEDGKVVAPVSIELLFTEDLKLVGKSVPNETPEWWAHNRIWANLSLGRLLPHVRLYRHFQSLAGPPADYLQWYRNLFLLRGLQPEFDDTTLLAKRHDHFRVMSACAQTGGFADPSFVIDVAFVKRQAKFFVLDGHHRAMFLRAMGARQIPARMSEDDFNT